MSYAFDKLDQLRPRQGDYCVHPPLTEWTEKATKKVTKTLFVRERNSGRISLGLLESREESTPLGNSEGTTAERRDRISRLCKKLSPKSDGDGPKSSHMQQTSRKRRRSPTCEMLNSEDGLNPSRSPPTAIAYQERKSSKRMKVERRKTAALQAEDDRRFTERLAAEEEDDLLMLLEGQWTTARPGTKGRPIDLDRHTRISLPPRLALRSPFNIRSASKTTWKSRKLRQNENFDAAIAHQIQKEEALAQEARLREAASRTRDCAVCGDATLVIELPSLSSCAHNADVCADCYTAWLGSQLAENGWQEVKCPGQSCKVNLTYEEIKAYASKEIFERYDAIQARNALSADPNFRWCRAEGCTSGQIHDPEEVGNVFVCVECHERFCTVHGGAYHDNETCEEYEYRTSGQQDRDERKKEDEASEEAVKSLAKKCPKQGCGSPIQKNGGCNHITCWKCRHHFCYVCLESDWNRCGHLHLNV